MAIQRRASSPLPTLALLISITTARTAMADECYVLIEGSGGAAISSLSNVQLPGLTDRSPVSSFGFNGFRPVDADLIPGALEVQPFRITKDFDASSPRLLTAFASSEVLSTFHLSCGVLGQTLTETSSVTLTNAEIVSQSKAGVTSENPQETLSFTFSSLTWTHTELTAQGAPGATTTGTLTP